jgi:hypothetical protein
MASATFLEAPADRPAGQRGWRAWAACAVAVAALPVLAMSTYADPPGWTGPVFLFAAFALTAAAVILWTARRRAFLGLAAVMVAAALAAGVVAESAHRREQREREKWGGSVFHFDEQGPAITRAEAEAVPEGSTKDEVRAILGRAAGSGIQRVNDGKDLRCVAYRASDHRGPLVGLYAFCFSDGRYSDLRKW